MEWTTATATATGQEWASGPLYTGAVYFLQSLMLLLLLIQAAQRSGGADPFKKRELQSRLQQSAPLGLCGNAARAGCVAIRV